VDDHVDLAAGGWHVVEPGNPERSGGLVAHRGVLQPEEYVDFFDLRAAVEEALGYTYAEVSAAYKVGRSTAEQRQLRERIDSRLLALSRSRGNLRILSEALGLNEKTIDRALVRAKAVEVSPVVKNPAVQTPCVSFMTGLPGASPKRRRHKGCPSGMMPVDGLRTSYINLTDEEYARGA
jgi:hypothetical protein